MNTVLLAWVRRHNVIAYCLLAYAITWILVVPLVTDGLGLTTWHAPAVWHALGALGPMVAAFVVTALIAGRTGVRQLVASMSRWRVGVGWVLVAILSPFGMFALAAIVLRLVGQPWPDLSLLARQFGNTTWLLGAFLAAAVYGLGEEPGWRGFALPRLQRRHGALVASLLVGGIWAAWHIPFFAYRYHLGGIDLFFFVLGVLAGSIWLTGLYNSTGGSVLMVMLWHVTWNMANAMAAAVSGGIVVLLTVQVIITAVVILLIWKPANLSPATKYTHDTTPTSRTAAQPPRPVGSEQVSKTPIPTNAH
jgi:uncharacterized protein